MVKRAARATISRLDPVSNYGMISKRPARKDAGSGRRCNLNPFRRAAFGGDVVGTYMQLFCLAASKNAGDKCEAASVHLGIHELDAGSLGWLDR
jgi:hypothetical protein